MGFELQHDPTIETFRVDFYLPEQKIVVDCLLRFNVYPATRVMQNYNIFKKHIIVHSKKISDDYNSYHLLNINQQMLKGLYFGNRLKPMLQRYIQERGSL